MTDWKNIAPITHAETERAGRRFVWQLAAFLVCIPLVMIAMRVWIAPWIERQTGPVKGSPFSGLAGPGVAATADAPERTVTLFIHGMECAMCAVQVEEALGKVPGVRSVSADFESGRTELTCRASDPAAMSAAIAEAISKTKYTIADGPVKPAEDEPVGAGPGEAGSPGSSPPG